MKISGEQYIDADPRNYPIFRWYLWLLVVQLLQCGAEIRELPANLGHLVFSTTCQFVTSQPVTAKLGLILEQATILCALILCTKCKDIIFLFLGKVERRKCLLSESWGFRFEQLAQTKFLSREQAADLHNFRANFTDVVWLFFAPNTLCDQILWSTASIHLLQSAPLFFLERSNDVS